MKYLKDKEEEKRIFDLAIEKGYTYNHITGDILNKKGQILKRQDTRGYYRFAMYDNGRQYNLYNHRFGFYFYYKKLPINIIDHIDINLKNNKIENLRDVTPSFNNLNTNRTGVDFHKRVKKWRARIGYNKKRKNLGYFNTEAEAHNAYLEAKKKYLEQ